MKQSSLLTILLLALLLTAVAGCGTEQVAEPDTEPAEEIEEIIPVEIKTGHPMDTLETFVRVNYFNEGSYDDYKELFLESSSIKSEQDFREYRRSTEPEDIFPVGYESVEQLMKHMRKIEIDESTTEIYYVEDPEQEGIEGAQFFWILEETDEQWLLN